MLALSLTFAAALLPVSPTAHSLVRTPPFFKRANTASMRFGLDQERVESAKVCAIAAISGGVAAMPVAAINDAAIPFQIGMFAAELALFGAVYRCTVRSDDNTMLRQGVVGAFALVRAFASLPVSREWTEAMSGQLFGDIWQGIFVFGCASYAIEYAWRNGWARPLEGNSQALGGFYDDIVIDGRNNYDRFGNYNDYGRGYRGGFGDAPNYRRGYGPYGANGREYGGRYGDGGSYGGYDRGNYGRDVREYDEYMRSRSGAGWR